jgi:hypothetical protein
MGRMYKRTRMGKYKKCIQTEPWVENLKNKDYDLGVDDKMREYIKMDVSKLGGEDMD